MLCNMASRGCITVMSSALHWPAGPITYFPSLPIYLNYSSTGSTFLSSPATRHASWQQNAIRADDITWRGPSQTVSVSGKSNQCSLNFYFSYEVTGRNEKLIKHQGKKNIKHLEKKQEFKMFFFLVITITLHKSTIRSACKKKHIWIG